MEDDLKNLVNRRQSKLYSNGRQSQCSLHIDIRKCNQKELKLKQCRTAPGNLVLRIYNNVFQDISFTLI